MNGKQEDIQIYVDQKNIGKKPMLFRLIVLNIIFLAICFLTSQLILIKKGVSYAAANPFLYEIINPTENSNKSYSFKGNAQNNYLVFNNLVWRIVKVNASGSITIVLDKPINMLSWSLEDGFNITDYLNNKFAASLDTEMLINNNLCRDEITDLNSLTCDDVDSNLVSLLDVYSFINTIDEGESFVAGEDEILWLENKNAEKAWHTNGSRVSFSSPDLLYEIKPVVTLKNTVLYYKGDGSYTNPYVIETTNLTVGSVVKLDNDLYEVYSIEDDIRLVSLNSSLIPYTYDGYIELMFSYLNNNYYENLPYKNILQNSKWDIVNINNGKIEKDTLTSYFGVQNILDIKIDDTNDYYLASKINNYALVYDKPIIYGSKNTEHYLRPCITLAKDMVGSLELYDGIFIARGL